MPYTSLLPARLPLHPILLQAHILTDRDESPPRGRRRRKEIGQDAGREEGRERGEREVEMSCIPAGCYARNRHGVLRPTLRLGEGLTR